MHVYDYQACDIEGNIQYGQISADTEQEVVINLQNQQLIPLKVEQQPDNSPGMLSLGRRSIKNRDLIDFTNGLTTLVEARIPLDRALTLLEGTSESAAVQQLVADLRRDVKEGKSLADALQMHPEVFSRMYVNMVHAGEEGGILDKLLPKLADFLATADEAKRTVISSLIYPMILLITGVGSVILLMIFVVPQFATLFADMGSDIPDSAAFLLQMSQGLQEYGWVLLVLPFLIFFGWRQLDSTPERRLQRDRFLLSVPLFGNLLLEAESSRFCRTLGALLAAGIPLLKGLHIVRGIMQNQVLAEGLMQVEESVRGGTSLGKALNQINIFPILLSQLIVVGEESGRTAEILEKLATTFEANVKQQTARLVALAEPLLILVLGIIIGAIVITMLSAVFGINQTQL